MAFIGRAFGVIALAVLFGCEAAEVGTPISGDESQSNVPTYNSWPPGTQAGSRGMVRNISPNSHQFARVSAPHPIRFGNMSERFELRGEDCSGSDCSAPRQRSEIIVGNSLRRQNPKLDEDVWVGWSFFNKSASRTPFFQPVFGQWKVNRDENGGHAIVSFKTNRRPSDLPSRRGSDDVFVELDDMRVKGGYNNRANSWGNVCSLFNLNNARDRWIDIVINTNFGTNENGYLKVWVNGTQKCNYQGRIVASKKIDFGGADHRRGLYWSSTGEWDEKNPSGQKPTMVVYYDEFRVGRSREQVDVRLITASGGPSVD